MKFLVFNIVVAIALVYLATDRFGGPDIALPGLDRARAAAERLVDGEAANAPSPPADTAKAPSPPAQAPAARPVNPFSILDKDRTVDAKSPDAADAKAENQPAPTTSPVAAPPAAAPSDAAPMVDAPVIAPADLKPPAKTFVAEAPAPLDASVARRRAEVLGEAPPASPSPAPAQPAAERRRQLLDLAEQMEYMAAEFAGRR